MDGRPRGSEILVVEDDRGVAQFVKRCLTMSGFAVGAPVASAAEAIARLEESAPALVILDIRLEGPMDGIELGEVIRTRWRVPILYVTGQGDDATVRRAVSTGPFGFVRKPFDDVQLRAAVEVALYKAAEDRQRAQALERSKKEAEVLAAARAAAQDRLRLIAEVVGVQVDGEDAARLPSELKARVERVSVREAQVLQLLLGGHRVSSIARFLGVSPFTVRNHLRALFRKTGAHSQEHLLDLFRGIPPRALDPLLQRARTP